MVMTEQKPAKTENTSKLATKLEEIYDEAEARMEELTTGDMGLFNK